jgi:hypothetical protein
MKYLLTAICIMFLSLVSALNVSGHLTQDTIWSPEHNPYVITGFLYVDAGVTLTVLPGVQVMVYDADGSNYGANFQWTGGQEPLAKAIIVRGVINAVGTESQYITFDNYSGLPERRWGGIVVLGNAPRSTFRYCNLNHTYRIFYNNIVYQAALSLNNGLIDVRHCYFYNDSCGIETFSLAEPALLYKCVFRNDYEMPNYDDQNSFYIDATNSFPNGFVDVIIASCVFLGEVLIGGGANVTRYYIYNKMLGLSEGRFDPEERPILWGCKYSYGNYYYNSGGIAAIARAPTDTVYCRRNTITQTIPTQNNVPAAIGSFGSSGTIYVSDNTAYGNVNIRISDPELLTYGYFHNNKVFTNNRFYKILEIQGDLVEDPFNISIFNNTLVALTDSIKAITTGRVSGNIFANTFYGFNKAIGDLAYSPYQIYNNVFANVGTMGDLYYGPNMPVFTHNALSFPLIYPQLDGGGNIYADPILTDTLNYDFHLLPGSPCIDAGTTALPMVDFDADYKLRVSGLAPDMGAYEYGSVYIGGITGHVYDSVTNQPLDCAEIRISGKLPEFSDTLGCFTAPTGAGSYTVTVRRFDYNEVTIPNVNVFLGENTVLNIPLQNNTASEEDIIPVPEPDLTLYSYPNPFRDKTTLSYILPQKQPVQLAIYNLKGQQVFSLPNAPNQKGLNAITWNGTDDTGRQVSSGIYFCKLISSGKVTTSKLVMLK